MDHQAELRIFSYLWNEHIYAPPARIL